MNPKEIRIGNHIAYMINNSLKDGIIESISKNKVVVRNIDNTTTSVKVRTNIMGLPLTDEWLKSHGFRWSNDYELWNMRYDSGFILNKSYELLHIIKKGIVFRLKYIHELQNIAYDIFDIDLF